MKSWIGPGRHATLNIQSLRWVQKVASDLVYDLSYNDSSNVTMQCEFYSDFYLTLQYELFYGFSILGF